MENYATSLKGENVDASASLRFQSNAFRKRESNICTGRNFTIGAVFLIGAALLATGIALRVLQGNSTTATALMGAGSGTIAINIIALVICSKMAGSQPYRSQTNFRGHQTSNSTNYGGYPARSTDRNEEEGRVPNTDEIVDTYHQRTDDIRRKYGHDVKSARRQNTEKSEDLLIVDSSAKKKHEIKLSEITKAGFEMRDKKNLDKTAVRDLIGKLHHNYQIFKTESRNQSWTLDELVAGLSGAPDRMAFNVFGKGADAAVEKALKQAFVQLAEAQEIDTSKNISRSQVEQLLEQYA